MNRIARFALPHGRFATVVRGPAKGMRFVVGPAMGMTYALGTNVAAPRCFSRWIRPGQTVYDLGANRGQMSLIFSSLVGPSGRVVALEPSPADHAALLANVELNGLDNVHCLNVAASDSEGDVQFDYNPEHPTQGKLTAVEPTYTVLGAKGFRVKTIRLDSLLESEPPPDFMKIDVEGAAAVVLKGASRILDKRGPGVFLELHGPHEQAAIKNELVSRGYIVETLDGNRVENPTMGWKSPVWCYRL